MRPAEAARLGPRRGDHYFHSSFNDLVLSGLIGVAPEVNGTVRVRPWVQQVAIGEV